MFKDIKAQQVIAMALVVISMIGLGFKVEYSGWVLVVGLLMLW